MEKTLSIHNRGKILLPIARAAIAQALSQPFSADESADWLFEPGACFVTLTQRGELRGCIGSLQAHRPLLDDVKQNAVSAALHDPRFLRLQAEELESTSLEISLLSRSFPLKAQNKEDALAQLRPGVDGLIFEYGCFCSTFLPQVWDQLPDPKQFMAHLKTKAGMPHDFWAKDVKLSRYQVTQWSEEEQNHG